VIEWIIALVIGLASIMVIYSVSFVAMTTIVKKRRSEGSIPLGESWKSSAIVSPIVLCLSFLVIFLISSGLLHPWGFQLPSMEDVVLLGTIGLITAIVVVILSEHFSPTPKDMNPPSDPKGRITFFVIIVLLASLSEEMLFRGLLQNILDNSLLIALDLGWLVITGGAIVSAIVFGIIHAAPAKQMGASVAVLVLSASILGLIAGIFLSLSGSLLLPIIVHIEFNLTGFILGIRKSKAKSVNEH
jgi:membrane protease YdiL (CAAX protease family)